FFRLAETLASGRQPSIRDAPCGCRQAPAGLWAVAVLCAFLFMIWITDAAILYSFMIGGLDTTSQLPWLSQLQQDKVAFTLWSSLTGAVLAFFVFAVSAFSVPLLHQRRATLIQAVHASVSLVLRHF